MDGLRKRLQKMRENLTNPSPTMQKVSILMHKDVMDHFGKESDEKNKWVPLKYKRKRGGSARILQDTGRMRSSISPSNTKEDAIVGTGIVYAATHQYGDSNRNIPQRKFLWLSKEIKEQITKLVGKFSIGE